MNPTRDTYAACLANTCDIESTTATCINGGGDGDDFSSSSFSSPTYTCTSSECCIFLLCGYAFSGFTCTGATMTTKFGLNANINPRNNSASQNKGLDAGIIAGIVIGCILGVLAVAAFVVHQRRVFAASLGSNDYTTMGNPVFVTTETAPSYQMPPPLLLPGPPSRCLPATSPI
jgi:hypothetical protein